MLNLRFSIVYRNGVPAKASKPKGDASKMQTRSGVSKKQIANKGVDLDMNGAMAAIAGTPFRKIRSGNSVPGTSFRFT